MRVGVCIIVQNYHDWDRFESEERGRGGPGATAYLGPFALP